jgi:SAM-dependent methyltransferase
MNTVEHQKKHFNAVANTYYKSRQDGKHLLLKRAIWDEMNIQINNDDKVLEAMCGYCDAYDIIKPLGKTFEYDAFDYSEYMIDLSKKKYPNANIWLQDITKFKSEKKYDLIFVIGGLHHVYEFVEVSISNLVESLNVGGKIIIFEPINNNIIFKLLREVIYQKNKLFDEETEKAFTTRELNSLFQLKGLMPIDQLFPGLLAYVLWYNPDAFPWLNKGSLSIVKMLLVIEKPLWRTILSKYFSFAMLAVYG